MSTFGNWTKYVMSKPVKSGTTKRLPRDQWEQKLRDEGKWVDYRKR